MPSFRSKVVYWVTKAVVGVFYNPQSSIQRIRREFTITTKLIPQKQAGSFERTTVDGIPAPWVIPDQISNDKVVLYFHGGGYSVCSPFCNTMMTDGVKHFEKEESVKVYDVAELIAQAADL